MTMDSLTIFIALIKITALLLIILSISLICARFRVKNKDIFILSIFASAVFLHQYVLCFPLMYLSYAVVILSGIIYILFCLYTRFKNKEQSHPLLKMIILTLLLLLPSFGGIRSYYLYKPLYLLNAKHLISNDAELPVLSYFTANPVKTTKQSVDYEIGIDLPYISHIIITFDEALEKVDIPGAKNFRKIDRFTTYFEIYLYDRKHTRFTDTKPTVSHNK